MRRATSLLAALFAGSTACASSSIGSGDGGGGGGGDGGADGDGGANWADAPPGTEICDGIDNDGDQFVDEGGDELCMPVPANAIPECNGLGGCRIGSCGIGFADVDNQYMNGCECAQESTENGGDCTTAVDLGAVPDTAAQVMVVGNLVPVGDADWYRFQAVDTPDTVCDAYHVRVRVMDDANAEFQVEVWRGGCGGTQICPGSTDVQWYTNFIGPGAPPTGQCPCTDPSIGSLTSNNCTDDSAEYIIKVTRVPGKPTACTNYTLEVSNGVYPAP